MMNLLILWVEVKVKLTTASVGPTVIMLVGLQGAGKTTMCGKLALQLKKR